MGWIENLISYCDSADPGNCPVCGCCNVEVMKHPNNERSSVTFRCKGCGATDHFDGLRNSSHTIRECGKAATER